jgi:predicted Zn-dependent protease
MDLLTTVMHELGHVLGLDSDFDSAHQDDLMYAYLQTGYRHAAVDAVFANYGA